MTIFEQALRIAAVAHAGQVRKEGGVPYIVHPVTVAHMLGSYGCSEAVLAAALLHDVLEDTDVTEESLRSDMGQYIVDLIIPLTQQDIPDWRKKKEAYIEAVCAASEETKLVALADKIHNAESLLDVYQREGEATWSYFNASREDKLWFEESMLAMLLAGIQHPLVERYRVLVEKLRALP